jgi:hypothetical protein
LAGRSLGDWFQLWRFSFGRFSFGRLSVGPFGRGFLCRLSHGLICHGLHFGRREIDGRRSALAAADTARRCALIVHAQILSRIGQPAGTE